MKEKEIDKIIKKIKLVLYLSSEEIVKEESLIETQNGLIKEEKETYIVVPGGIIPLERLKEGVICEVCKNIETRTYNANTKGVICNDCHRSVCLRCLRFWKDNTPLCVECFNLRYENENLWEDDERPI